MVLLPLIPRMVAGDTKMAVPMVRLKVKALMGHIVSTKSSKEVTYHVAC